MNDRTGGRVDASSSRIVPTPRVLRRVAPTGDFRSTWKVSSGSTSVSPFTVTSTGCDRLPGGKLTLPEAAT